jgi:hypothetical protein
VLKDASSLARLSVPVIYFDIKGAMSGTSPLIRYDRYTNTNTIRIHTDSDTDSNTDSNTDTDTDTDSDTDGEVSLIPTFFERVAEVRDSPKFFKILRILLKYYHIIMTMGMY